MTTEHVEGKPAKAGLTYKDAGVDIDAGNQLVERIKGVVRQTTRPEVLGGLGGFGALCRIPAGYKKPVLVAGTDGVGTKLKLALESNYHSTVGIDLVAMCVNDLVVAGAEPLFFLDYYATGALDVDVATDVVHGIAEGCKQAGCALIGGETAEMPGMYQQGDYDLAGFCVGVVEEDGVIDGSAVQSGDALLALASSGPHSNGYSLIRKIIEHSHADTGQLLDGKPLMQRLLEPTRIYVKSLLQLTQQVDVHAMAHITGGGLLENIPRVLPEGLAASIRQDSWKQPAVFDWLQVNGGIDAGEMHRTFNCGVGMVIAVAADHCEQALALLHDAGEEAWQIGEVTQSAGTQVIMC